MNKLPLVAAALLTLTALAACHTAPGHGGGQKAQFSGARNIQAGDIAVPQGYRIEPVAWGLTFPTDIAFDEQGNQYVTEAGYSYGEVFVTPRLVRLKDDGGLDIIAQGDRTAGPWTGLAYRNGYFYVTDGGVKSGGRVLRISKNGDTKVLLDNLPSVGDHHVNGPAIGPDGKLYFAIGTATNSAVVGPDNAKFGWLYRFPDFHDIPAKDITLAGVNYTSPNPLSKDPDDTVLTGAYVPFGTATRKGQVIKGQNPATGAVYRMPLDGGKPELVGWGFRNPYGLAFNPQGQLYITENQFDVRGLRPVWGTGDLLWTMDPNQDAGRWHGWPDYYNGHPLDMDKRFKPPGQDPPKRLLAQTPNEPPHALVPLGVHSASNLFDVSRSKDFGHEGDLFIAQFGDMAPNVGKVMAPVGFQVVRVHPKDATIHTFAVNKPQGEKTYGPASYLNAGGLERPNAAKFSPDGNALYIVDFGVMTMGPKGANPRKQTGVIWRITREAQP